MPDPNADGGESIAQKHERLDGSVALVARAAAGWTTTPALTVARARDVAIVEDKVQVIVESTGDRSQTAAAVRAVGGTVQGEYEDLVQALVAPAQLEPLAASPAVKYIRRPAQMHPDAVTSEGVAASGANVWQTAGVSGSGVKVGVIDFGFTGYQARQAGGDLPANLITRDLCPGAFNSAGGEHGTAVAEIVYDMAPGAQLYLICVGTEVELGQAKDYAKSEGISILVMSASWFNTSRGDGTGSASSPNATVKDARDSGIFWVNSAGNRAQQHYSANFNDTDNNQNHNYTGSDNGNTVFLSQNQQACVFLRWDAWPATNQDFDLIISRSDNNQMVAQSNTAQTGTQTPTEGICYTNTTGSAQNFAIVVRKFSATSNPFFDLFITPGPNLEHQTAAGSVTEPGSSPSAFAVGAICFQNDRFETYSSQGPTIDGRIKPDIAGQSVVTTASFAGPVACPSNSNGTGGFNGTSAAAPHVAGAAVLVKAANPSFTAAQLQTFLEGRALDLGTSGKDNQTGIGKLRLGDPPAASINCTPRPSVTVQTAVSNGRLSATVTVSGTGNNLLSIVFGNGTRVPVNALLDLPDGRTGLTGTPTFTAPSGATTATFFVRRQVSGNQTFVPFVVTDRCGTWGTFVGGGTGATGF
jgi:subtilisin family serine protease